MLRACYGSTFHISSSSVWDKEQPVAEMLMRGCRQTLAVGGSFLYCQRTALPRSKGAVYLGQPARRESQCVLSELTVYTQLGGGGGCFLLDCWKAFGRLGGI